MVFGGFVPPLAWRRFPNLVVYRMHPGVPGVSFNFNKIRAMISARVVTGIELDTDQLIYHGMDKALHDLCRVVHSLQHAAQNILLHDAVLGDMLPCSI